MRFVNKLGTQILRLRYILSEIYKERYITTTRLMELLDPMHFGMIKLKYTMRSCSPDYKPRNQDFSLLYKLIYRTHAVNPDICSGCLSNIESDLERCPYCDTELKDRDESERLKKSDLDITAPRHRHPRWDVDYSYEEILEKNRPLPEKEIDPPVEEEKPKKKIQKVDLSGVRKLTPRTKHDPLAVSDYKDPNVANPRNNNSLIKKIETHLRKAEVGKHFPFSKERLWTYGADTLRTIIGSMPGHSADEVRRFKKKEMIPYILQHQPQQPIIQDSAIPYLGTLFDLEKGVRT